MNLQLEGKRALVTGSTAGIGFAVANTLAAEGAHVIVNGRKRDRIENALTQIKSQNPQGSVEGIVVDFADRSSIEDLLNQCDEVDILVNNVGIFKASDFTQTSDEEWYEMFDVNVMSGIRLARHYFPKMMAKNWGRIIFISSESGVQVDARWVHYGMSKTAQLGVANGLARLTKGSNVTVNAVLPGSTMSEGASAFVKGLAEEQNISEEEAARAFIKNERPNCLLERFATTQEVANMIAYLSSPLASATNGATIRADGGTIPTIL